MSGMIKRAVALALALGWLAGTAAAAGDTSSTGLKQLMGENFQVVGKILTDLIAARYDSIPAESEAIMKHADQLMAMPPASVKSKAERDLFLSYATNLKIASSHLMVVTTELAQRDKEHKGGGEMNIDYLRAVAAEHYGSMVTSCVLCHNQFRRHPL